MTNMTYAQALEIAINTVMDKEAVDRLTALKVQLEKRSSSKTPTKVQKANEGIMETILRDIGEFGKPVTVTELINGGEGLEDLSNQKVSALLKKLVEAGKVTKTIEKKKAYFSLAE